MNETPIYFLLRLDLAALILPYLSIYIHDVQLQRAAETFLAVQVLQRHCFSEAARMQTILEHLRQHDLY